MVLAAGACMQLSTGKVCTDLTGSSTVLGVELEMKD